MSLNLKLHTLVWSLNCWSFIMNIMMCSSLLCHYVLFVLL